MRERYAGTISAADCARSKYWRYLSKTICVPDCRKNCWQNGGKTRNIRSTKRSSAGNGRTTISTKIPTTTAIGHWPKPSIWTRKTTAMRSGAHFIIWLSGADSSATARMQGKRAKTDKSSKASRIWRPTWKMPDAGIWANISTCSICRKRKSARNILRATNTIWRNSGPSAQNNTCPNRWNRPYIGPSSSNGLWNRRKERSANARSKNGNRAARSPTRISRSSACTLSSTTSALPLRKITISDLWHRRKRKRSSRCFYAKASRISTSKRLRAK